jgi:hypothetical protein
MGALVGSLYATQPGDPTDERYRALLGRYRSATLRDTAGNAALGGVVGGVVAGLLSEGEAWPIIAGIGAGALVGAGTTDKLQLDRLVGVLDEFYGATTIEKARIPYATLTHDGSLFF